MFDEYKLNTDEDIPGGKMTVIIFSNATVEFETDHEKYYSKQDALVDEIAQNIKIWKLLIEKELEKLVTIISLCDIILNIGRI